LYGWSKKRGKTSILPENPTNPTVKELSEAEIERKERKERFIEHKVEI
jgi:hypothetical protein